MRILRLALAGALALVTMGPRFTWAMDDDDEFFQSISRSPAEYSLRRAYAGARDEQPLQIQAILPQPSRSPDGAAPVLMEESELAPAFD